MNISNKLRESAYSFLVACGALHCSVGFTTDHSLSYWVHHLWLRNPETLYGVESSTLAPGYIPKDKFKKS